MILGHEVDIYATPNPDKNSKLHADFQKYELEKRTFYFENTYKNPAIRLVKALLCLLALACRRPKQSKRLVCLNASDLSYKLEAWIYSRMPPLQGKPYDIIHCHFANHNRKALLIQSVSSPEAKIVTTFHGYDVNVNKPARNPAPYSEIFSKGSIFTANTQFTANKAKLLGCPAEKIEILPVGLDLSRYPYSPRQLPKGKPIRIVTVGRLVEKKGIDYAIKAVAKTIQQRPDLDIEYIIIGQGVQGDSLKQLAKDLGISEKVCFLGGMTQEEVRETYSSSHLFMLSSVTATNGDMEGQGLVLQEAQCVGLPVISTLHNGIPEGVLDGRSGFLSPRKRCRCPIGEIDLSIIGARELEINGSSRAQFC